MQSSQIQIAARGIKLTDFWREKILGKAEKLAEFHPRITHCRAVVEVPHKHRHKGRLFNVRIDVEVPRGLVVVDREPAPSLSEAVDRAFDAAARRLEDQLRVIRGHVKHHESGARGAVAELFPDEGYGFIEAENASRVYFHKNAVLGGDFPRLTVGSEVRYAEEAGEKGPQARSLTLVKRAPRQERRRAALRRRQAPSLAVGATD